MSGDECLGQVPETALEGAVEGMGVRLGLASDGVEVFASGFGSDQRRGHCREHLSTRAVNGYVLEWRGVAECTGDASSCYEGQAREI